VGSGEWGGGGLVRLLAAHRSHWSLERPVSGVCCSARPSDAVRQGGEGLFLSPGGGGPPDAVLPTMASRDYYVFLYTVRLAYPPCNSVIHVIAQGGDF
jgi:hypothetical protein